MKAKLDPAGFFARIPLQPHQMMAPRTSTADMIVLCHLGVPQLDRAAWRLRIDGRVDTPIEIDFAALTAFEKFEVASVHQCAGSPLKPEVPTRRVTNVVWGGVRLSDLLAQVGVRGDARYLWSAGADHGTFGDAAVDAYVKDLPLARIDQDVLVAYELNGAPLPVEHGFPARLVVPGYYGTNSVKWLTRLTLAADRADSPFTTRWYNDPDPATPGMTRPVWGLAPESVIVSPAPGAAVKNGETLVVSGWAWADGGVATVDISIDGGATWHKAALAPAAGRQWRAFSFEWTPSIAGACELAVRAVSQAGEIQPMSGRRNAVHRVEIAVV